MAPFHDNVERASNRKVMTWETAILSLGTVFVSRFSTAAAGGETKAVTKSHYSVGTDLLKLCCLRWAFNLLLPPYLNRNVFPDGGHLLGPAEPYFCHPSAQGTPHHISVTSRSVSGYRRRLLVVACSCVMCWRSTAFVSPKASRPLQHVDPIENGLLCGTLCSCVYCLSGVFPVYNFPAPQMGLEKIFGLPRCAWDAGCGSLSRRGTGLCCAKVNVW